MILQTLLKDKQDKNQLLSVIDSKIALLAKRKMEEIKYRVNNCANFKDTQDLLDLKEVYQSKLKKDQCLSTESMDSVTSIIQKYLNK